MKRIICLFAGILAGLWVYTYAACTPVSASWPLTSSESFEQLTTAGTNNAWYFDAGYSCAVASYNSADLTAWLITPAVDLRDALNVSFAFSHTHKFAGDPSVELTLWVCAEYNDDPATADWKQLTIPAYNEGQSSWSWKENSIVVPVSLVGSKTVFGFCYKTTATDHAKWEIKNVTLESMCAGGGGDTPHARLRVCGQNMRNYYINYDNYSSSRANYDHAAFADKTMKIVKSFIKINADIFAMCEIEACPLVLTQLCDSLNKYIGEDRYAAVSDGINVAWDSYDNNMKSGFIYRKDKVKPFGSNTAASTWQYYKNTMRIQGFQEISSNEKMVVSMNHFKAKTGDGGDQTRKDNATHLISALKKSLGDPDILILGDLNCEVGEEPITMLINAGYSEQLVRFDEGAYSHCYGGEGSLIDHAMANSTMSQQIKYTQVYHNCTTSCGVDNYATSYSDHDPYVVDITLGDYNQGVEGVRQPVISGQKMLIDGQLFILLPDGEMYDIMGKRVQK